MASNGEIYFGSKDGLVVFHPDSLKDNPYVPPVVITAFSIHNQSVPVMATDADTLEWKSPLTQNISYTKDMVLHHFQNDFTFEFAALNFINPESNQYKYKLEPYETEWVETNAVNRVARYTNISPGKYSFRVIGSNDDGLWNEEGASILITITPPWWQTGWAHFGYALIVMGLLILARWIIVQREWLQSKLKLEQVEHAKEHFILEHAKEVDSLKTRFFTNISHEFRTPMTLILGPLKELYSKANSNDQKTLFGTMLRNGQRLLRLINQLLDLSKLEAGKMVLQPVQTDLVKFLKEIAAAYESLAANKGIKYFFYPEVHELLAYVDQEKLEKVIHNLLSNAFKFTSESGEVILYLKAEVKSFSITVKDTGIGIPSNQINKVFDRFYQVDSSQTRGYEGSGLGMALAKELVELHHGTISVESKEGVGTTFTVQLPLGKEPLTNGEGKGSANLKSKMAMPEEMIPGATFAAAPKGNGNIAELDGLPIVLIVEDNTDMRDYIRKTLSEHYQIIEAINGKVGVAKAKEIIPDLIISDIMMPEMDGFELCKLIKTSEATSHIPVILLTAKADRESKLSGLEIGADDYLSKPFDADELKLIVRNRIEERRKMRERFSKEITLEPKQILITSLDEKFLIKVLAIIEAHMDDEHFSVDALSHEVGYSNMQFYRKLKALAGETPNHFIRTIRLKRAANLLSKHSDNVGQVAYSVGFSSLSHFNKCFKEQFGVTPGQFAESRQRK